MQLVKRIEERGAVEDEKKRKQGRCKWRTGIIWNQGERLKALGKTFRALESVK